LAVVEPGVGFKTLGLDLDREIWQPGHLWRLA